MAYDAKDPDTIKALKAAVDAALLEAADEHETAVEGLKTKNTELLGKLKKAREGKDGDPEEVTRLEAALEKASGDLKVATKALTKVTAERDTHKSTAESEAAAIKGLVVNNGLLSELTAIGVKKEFMPAVTKLLADKVEQTIDGDKRSATVAGKPLSDFIKTWSQSDEGKIYVTAPANGGADAPGGKAATTGKTMTRAAFDGADQLTRSAFAKEGGVVVE